MVLPTLLPAHGYLLLSTVRFALRVMALSERCAPAQSRRGAALTLPPPPSVRQTSMCVYGFLAGFVYAGASRRETFNDAWASSPAGLALQAEHKAAVGDAIKFSTSGYPDMGSGRYAATLPYAAWLKFGMAQRAHYNLVEVFAPTLGLQVLTFTRPNNSSLITGVPAGRVCEPIGPFVGGGGAVVVPGGSLD